MNGCATGVVPFHEFSRRVHTWADGARVPVNGSIELTYRCNIQCAHCYIPHRSGAGELSLDEWKRVLDEATEAGCLFLLISGGEPFLRKDALDIFLHAKRNGLIVTLFTNGTLITERVAEALAEFPPFSVEITLYGAGPETYERVTKVRGAYEKAMRGVRLLHEAGLRLTLKTVVLTLNRHDLPALQALAASLGVPFRFDAAVHPRLDGHRHPVDVRLDPEAVVALDRQEPGRLEDLSRFHHRMAGPPDPTKLFQCGAGVNSFHVDPFGRLMVCESVGPFGYDLREGSFRDGWERYFAQVLATKPGKHIRCHECELHTLCGQCPAWSFMENGTLDDPVDYLCDITAARAEAMGLPQRPPGWTPEARAARRARRPGRVATPASGLLAIAPARSAEAAACVPACHRDPSVLQETP